MTKQILKFLKENTVNISALQYLDAWNFAFWGGIKCDYHLCCIIWYCDVQTNHGLQKDSLFERILRDEIIDNPILRASKTHHALCPDCLIRSLQTFQ